MNNNNAAVIDPSKLLKLSVSNIMASLLFQVRHELDHEELKSIVNNSDLFIDAISGSNMIDFMPWLGVIFPGKMKSFTELATKFRDILGVHVKNHHDNYQHGLDSDILYYLMTLSEGIDPKQRQELRLTDERIRSVVYDFFGAGFETVASTLMWAFLYAIYFPDLQKRMQEEMDDVIGRDRLPSLADRGRLPLTEAFLAEVSRHSSVVPTTLPHSTVRDTILEGGYNLYIPKDTVVFVNLYSIHCDPEEWSEPGKFDPKRFLSPDGQKLDNDKVDSLMRFGVGRRRCIGSEVAQMELFLYFTVILHQCSLRSTEGQKLTLKGEGSLLVVRPPKYDMEMVLR
ncbi:putative cytochrome P450 1A1-like [Apostichopus japonicus]|uniref:Putative cytochrome P450 1A1-like n=1 Tax=Stichopus japonicus TaxID=307972 RepID=A0A2G8L4N8_STIJA|nr:putative cytochrome P450 1A1-like [Apostichopus japonicus]